MCIAHDFAMVRLDRADHASVNPSIPYWGGPTGLRPLSAMATGERILAYGNSETRQDTDAIQPLEGTGEIDWENGWRHDVQFVTPGIPGDSGSAAIDNTGSAFGILTTLRFAPPAATGVTDLPRVLAYLRANTDLGMRLAEGTEPFTGAGDALTPSPAGAPDPQPEEQPAPVPVPPPPPAPAAPAPAARPAAKQKARRCPRGTVRRRIGSSRRMRCVKVKRRDRR